MYSNLFSFSAKSIILLEISIAPSPPFAQLSTTLDIISLFSNSFCTNSISFSESVLYLFIATIIFSPNFPLILSTCLYKLLIPFSNASIFSSRICSFETPPWYFRAFIVATHTTTLG